MKHNLIFIKVTNPSLEEMKYARILIENWHNYYKPENYLLPNMELVQLNQNGESL